MKTSKSTSWIRKLTIAALFLVGVWGALPSFYYAPYGAIGADKVSVYEPGQEASSTPLVAVQKIAVGPNPFVDTGKKVHVYIRNDYRDGRAQYVSLIFLSVLSFGLISHWLASRGGKENSFRFEVRQK